MESNKKLKVYIEIAIPKYNGDNNNFVKVVNDYMAKGEPVTFEERNRWDNVADIVEQGGGISGKDGVGIEKIEKTDSDGLIDTYTITYTNGETFTYAVTNGKDGVDGKNGLTPEIKDGYWWIADINTGVKAKGSDGNNGADGQDGHTPIITIQDGYWYVDGVNTGQPAQGETGKDGADGSSVSIVNIEESSEDGGANIVTFSNGDKLLVNNGRRGSDGADGKDGSPGAAGKDGRDGIDGKDGYTPQKGVDYWTEADQDEMEADNINFISTELAKRGQLKPEFANSVEECTDTTKLYVLPDGFIYAYMTKIVEEERLNQFDSATAKYNARISGSSGNETEGACVVSTPFINFANASPYIINVEGVTLGAFPGYGFMLQVSYYNNGTFVGKTYFTLSSASEIGSTDFKAFESVENGVYSADIYRSGITSNQVRISLCLNSKSTSISSTDTENLFLEFKPENKPSETIKEWMSTGHAFVPADYEDRILSLENDVLELKNGINEDEITVPDFWEDAVNECISKIKALQVGRNCITFPFFSDNHQRNGYSGVLIAKIMKECNIPFCFYGGDSIDSGYIASESVMIAQDKAFDKAMSYIPNGRFCRAVGNHDGYWAVSADEKYYYTDSQIYELFLREESVAQNKHFGGDGTYYYVDDIASKVRWIVLDTNDGTVEAEQIAWMQNTALKFDESGWAVVFISHQPISNHYHANISNASEVISAVATYINGSSANKAVVIGWFSGHIHRDRIYTGIAKNTTDDSVGTALPFKQVTITSDHTSIAYDDATKHTVANDDQSHAIDFVTINKNTRTVNLTRLGIGNDRSFSY